MKSAGTYRRSLNSSVISLKTREQIEHLHRANQIVLEVLAALQEAARPGMSTLALDQLATDVCRRRKVRPAFLGLYGFPNGLCISLNEEVVHGIPSATRILREGDVVSIDYGVVYEGWYGDAAITFGIGQVSDVARRLIQATEEALYLGIAQARVGNRLHDISAAVQALYVSGALRMGADYETKISSLMRRINGLVHRTFSDERFLTLFYAELSNDKKGLCVYANAGHNAPILYHPKTEQFEFLVATGQILGPFPDQRYRSEGVMISKGDVLVLYTDGVSEAMDSEGRMYTEQRLAQKIRENAGKSAKEITQLIIEDVQVFSTKSKYSDDKTVVTIKRRK